MNKLISIDQQKKNTDPKLLGDIPLGYFLDDEKLKPSFFMNLSQMEEAQSDFELVNNWNIEIKKKPFEMKYEEFNKLHLSDVKYYYDEVKKSFSKIMEEEWKKGFKQIVMCNKEIVYKTKNIKPIKNSIIKELAKKYGSECYIFNAPLFIEESSWNECVGETPYPTIPLYLGSKDADPELLVKKK